MSTALAVEQAIYASSSSRHYRLPEAERPLCGHGASDWVLFSIAHRNGDTEGLEEALPACRDCALRLRPGTVIRPTFATYAPDGYRWDVAADDDVAGTWRVLGEDYDEDRPQCRMMTAGHRCPELAIAELNRGRGSSRPIWWAYCGRHLYGRWLEGGAIVHWRLVPITPGGTS